MRDFGRLAAGVLLIHLALIQPNHPEAATLGAFRLFPLELPVIVIALAAARGRLRLALRGFLAGALALMSVLKLVDYGAVMAFGRPFNPYLDLHLAPAAWRMLSGAVGVPLALTGTAALVLALALFTGALWWATRQVAVLDRLGPHRRALLPLLAAAGGLALADAARTSWPFDPPGAAFTARLAWEHGRDAARARADLAAFRLEAAADPVASRHVDGELAGLGDSDAMILFVESYGRTAFENPLYAPTITATLDEIEARLSARGLAMRSGFLRSPVVGGQSWLAHATLLSGLEIDNQGRYGALMRSPRRTLLHVAQASGRRTVGVMPAITLAWPEGDYFGYDRVLAAADLGYGGRPFNWVTMPDQFTLLSFERFELDSPARPPVFAEIALISSHAPWTPIPPLLRWEEIGDGAVYDPYAAAGESPEAIWRDQDRVRDQFRQALDYSLRVVGAFAERLAAEDPLLIVLGDHQPARFVSLDKENQDVPIHAIGPPELVARLDVLGWTEGLTPGADAPAPGMETFRDGFLAAFRGRSLAACVHQSGREALPAPARC